MSPCPFPTTITITPRAPPHIYIYIFIYFFIDYDDIKKLFLVISKVYSFYLILVLFQKLILLDMESQLMTPHLQLMYKEYFIVMTKSNLQKTLLRHYKNTTVAQLEQSLNICQ